MNIKNDNKYTNKFSNLEEKDCTTLDKIDDFGVDSIVYKCSNELIGNFALKIEREIFDYKSKLYKEWNILYDLNHQYIIKLLSNPFLIKQKYCFALELGQKTLYDIINESSSNIDKSFCPNFYAKQYFCQILTAVEYLHRKSIAHCDIKPDNIVIFNNNIAKLIDFSRSIRVYTESDYPITPEGTLYYVSPEAKTNYLYRKNYNPFISDIYSLGATLFTLYTQRHFTNGCLGIIRENLPQEIIKIIKYIPDDLYDLLKLITQFNPDKRIKIEEIFEHEWIKDNFIKIEEIFEHRWIKDKLIKKRSFSQI